MDYDACGNMVYQEDNGEGLKKQMHYDAFNRISEVRDPDSGRLIGEYHYDDGGFRVRKLARRMMEGEEKLVEVLYPSMYFGIETQRTYEGQEIPDTSYAVNNIYVNGIRVAAVIPSGAARYYHTDQVDSVKVVTDDAGMPVSRFEYLPYGETWVEETADEVDEEHNPKFNSQELDRETGYYYYNARHYDPVICRFVTADTVVDGEGSAFGWNRYMYVHGNPVMYRDPTGHEVELEKNKRNLTANENTTAALAYLLNPKALYKLDIETELDDDKTSFKKRVTQVIANDNVVGEIIKGYSIDTYSNKTCKERIKVYDYDVRLYRESEYGNKGEVVTLSSIINKEHELDIKRSWQEPLKNLPGILTGKYKKLKSVQKDPGKLMRAKGYDLISDSYSIRNVYEEDGLISKSWELLKMHPAAAIVDSVYKAGKYSYNASYGMKAYNQKPIDEYGFEYEEGSYITGPGVYLDENSGKRDILKIEDY